MDIKQVLVIASDPILRASDRDKVLAAGDFLVQFPDSPHVSDEDWLSVPQDRRGLLALTSILAKAAKLAGLSAEGYIQHIVTKTPIPRPEPPVEGLQS